MVSLVVHFRWNWVGIIISDEDHGIKFLYKLREEMQRNFICLAFVSIITNDTEMYLKMYDIYYNQIMMSSAKVVIVYGDKDSYLQLNFILWKPAEIRKIWISITQFERITVK